MMKISIYVYLVLYIFFFFFKQKTAYEMRISDWSSDVCSSDLAGALRRGDHEFRKVVAIEHLHRDVDRDREVLSRAAPDAVLIQRLGDDDLGEVADEAVLFGDRDDCCRALQLAVDIPPAQEGFHADHPVVAHGDLRLVGQLDRAGCQSGADGFRSEEHTSELQSLMRISSAV